MPPNASGSEECGPERRLPEGRILVLTPIGRDAEIACTLLAKVGLITEICRSIDELCAGYSKGAGAALIGEEVLVPGAVDRLVALLNEQPPWSDFPIVVLTSGGATRPSSVRLAETLSRHGNVTFLERPVRAVTLQAALQGALRTRRRQYEKREYIAEREGLVAELEQERERLREAGRRKDEFLAMLAHELRNPLSPLTNALRLARFDGRRDEALNMAERQLRHLNRLLDDLLDVSRITLGKITLQKEKLELQAVVQLAIEATEQAIESRGHRLAVSIPSEPIVLEADRSRLAQILTNLLGNAVKYTDPGGQVSLTAEREGAEVILHVRDTGIGIAPEMIAKIFDPFTQANLSLERSEGGLGIGLTLVRNLVELHGGAIEAYSPGLGLGSDFVVRLPVSLPPATADRRPEASATSAMVRRLRVLVVDDNKDAAASIAALLEISGHQVAVADHGVAALEMTRTYKPDVVLLDIGLPGIDGYEVARRLRRGAGTRDILLIALSGYGQEEDIRRALDAGFDHHIVKPADPDAIEKILARRDWERSGQPARELH